MLLLLLFAVLGVGYLSLQMAEERDAFYVVRKGDMIGVYKSLSDCQAPAGSSVTCPNLPFLLCFRF